MTVDVIRWWRPPRWRAARRAVREMSEEMRAAMAEVGGAPPTWRTRDGRVVPVSEMEDSHLLNAIGFIRRRTAIYARERGVSEEDAAPPGLPSQHLVRGGPPEEDFIKYNARARLKYESDGGLQDYEKA